MVSKTTKMYNIIFLIFYTKNNVLTIINQAFDQMLALPTTLPRKFSTGIWTRRGVTLSSPMI